MAAGANLDGLKRADGSWQVWNNIQIDYFGKVGPKWGPVEERPLTVGFGFDDKHMGPELGFGVEMSKHFGPSADIRILKVAWGGTSLAKDWRPPSSVAKYGGVVGWCYTNFTAHVHAELSKLESPELVGVVWHQGWNDGCQASMVAEYERNLANLIRDIRSEFKSSYGTPLFSIPVSGLDSWRGRVARRNGIIHAQYAVSTYPEFKNNVASQETRGFVRFYDETGGACNQGYHFNCNGETYFYVGTVAGQAMSMLLNGTWVQPFINTTNPDDEADVEVEAEDERACRAERDGRRLLSPSANSTSRVGAWRERFGLGPYQSGKEERNAAALAAVIASRGFHVGDPKLYGFNAHEANKYSDGRRLSSSVDAVVAWRERFGIGPYESDAEERIRSASSRPRSLAVSGSRLTATARLRSTPKSLRRSVTMTAVYLATPSTLSRPSRRAT